MVRDDEVHAQYASQIGGGVHVEGDRLLPPTNEPGGAWRPRANRSNDYEIDRHAQRTARFAGPPGMSAQDAALQESMGTIFDRSSEHLGAADTAIIVMRRQLMRMARELEQGIEPTMLSNPDHFRTAPLAIVTEEPEFSRLWDTFDAQLKTEFARSQVV